jgi:hypothetical protein
MLYQITWSSYFEIVFLLLIPYYLIILYKYYRHDLLNMFTGIKVPHNDHSAAPGGNDTPVKHSTPEQSTYPLPGNQENWNSDALQAVQDEIQAFFSAAGNQNISRKEILDSLRFLVEKYGWLRSSSYKNLVQDLIVQKCETHCSVYLSEDELAEIWPG